MHLPPQAYTKETLIQAYNWLRSQPAQVQEIAKSPDALVSLYTKSQIHGENYLSRTNLQGFKSELKNLANIMGDLENPINEQQNAKPSLNKQSSASNNPQANTINQPQSPPPATNTSQTAGSFYSPNGNATTNSNPLSPMVTEQPYHFLNSLMNSTQNQEPQDLKTLLDARSWGMIQEVKNHLNLSSETEALRLLISLGYQKIRPQF